MGFAGKTRITRHRILRWAIIQHYEITKTPLLDVTHSLRVAASFATLDSDASSPTLYVFGVPSLGGSITASAEHDLQVMRLSTICPPSARRPHYQEGYLLGDYPEISSIVDERFDHFYRRDFGRRLLAKFRLDKSGVWGDPSIVPIQKEALFPDGNDPLFEIAEKIKAEL